MQTGRQTTDFTSADPLGSLNASPTNQNSKDGGLNKSNPTVNIQLFEIILVVNLMFR